MHRRWKIGKLVKIRKEKVNCEKQGAKRKSKKKTNTNNRTKIKPLRKGLDFKMT